VGQVAFDFHSLDWLLGVIDRGSLAPLINKRHQVCFG